MSGPAARQRRERVSGARLMVITDTSIAPVGVLERRIETIVSAARPRSVIAQLRDLALPVRERLLLGRTLSALCRLYEQWIIVNDRCDLAMILSADGVHLGESAVEPAEARHILGPDAWISCAAHDPARDAPNEADAIVLSPIFAPRKGNAALGIGALEAARRTLDASAGAVGVKLFALGGVDGTTAASALSAGADGVAVIGAALDGRDPMSVLRALDIAK